MSIWRFFLNTAKELAMCALALLSITASEAAVERSFSRQGLIHSKLRNRSKDDSIHGQMCFAFNSRTLERASLPPAKRINRGATQEIADEDDDLGKGTALLSQVDEEILEAARSGSEDEEEKVKERGEGADSDELERMEDSQSSEEEEEEEKRAVPLSAVERVQRFVEKYVAAHHITHGYRWTGPREGQLQAAIMEEKLQDMVDVMIKRIKDHVAIRAVDH